VRQVNREGVVGASGWAYFVAYQPNFQAALDELRRHVLETGDYWWAAAGEYGKSAADFPNRPTTEAELWEDEVVLESGTHSILDMSRIVADGEKSRFRDRTAGHAAPSSTTPRATLRRSTSGVSPATGRAPSLDRTSDLGSGQ
jgi:hypothetical protein